MHAINQSFMFKHRWISLRYYPKKSAEEYIQCSIIYKELENMTTIHFKAMAPHSSTLAWKIPWTKEPVRLQSMGSLRVGHDWATSLSRIGEGNGNAFQCSCLENPRNGGAWWVTVHGVIQSRTRLKWLSIAWKNTFVSFRLVVSSDEKEKGMGKR